MAAWPRPDGDVLARCSTVTWEHRRDRLTAFASRNDFVLASLGEAWAIRLKVVRLDEVNVLRMRIAEDFPSLGNPDDLELFERCQQGLSIDEIEWVDMSKGLGQVADSTFVALDNPREGYHAGQTVALNMLAGTGSMRRITTLWSRPPYERPMLTVIDDPVGVHFAWNGGRCSGGVYAIRDGIESGHRTCQGNLEEAVRPWGVDPDLIPDVFNVFMYTDVVDEHTLVFRESPAQAGDYIELRAEMDVLAAVSACPSETSASNGGEPKRIGLEVWEEPGSGATVEPA